MGSEFLELNDSPEITIWIDKYDDVFSDFDSRPYSDRVLSDDFLSEIRKMVIHQPKKDVKLTFRLMDNQRDEFIEAVIIENLRMYFQRAADELRQESKGILNKGYWMTGVGFSLSIALIFLAAAVEHIKYINHVPMVLEPVAWFTTWTGLDHVFQISRKNKPSLDFNLRMIKADIEFLSLEAPAENAATGTHGPVQKKVIPFGNNLRIAR